MYASKRTSARPSSEEPQFNCKADSEILQIKEHAKMTRDPLYRRHRFPAEIISHQVWLYFPVFPLT